MNPKDYHTGHVPIPPDLSWMVDWNRSKSCPHCNGTGRVKQDERSLQQYVKSLPDKLKWINDNATHHSSHWLYTQLYGLAREIESGCVNIGTKDFYRLTDRRAKNGYHRVPRVKTKNQGDS